MPKLFAILGYSVYFWVNEGMPVEPIHVHVCKGRAQKGATKIWITQTGKAELAYNSSQIPEKQLRHILRAIEAQSDEIISAWTDRFGKPKYWI